MALVNQARMEVWLQLRREKTSLRLCLRACRRDLAAEAGVPPYVIFHDATLREMAQVRPKSLRDMGLITGIGDRKLEAYGDAFLAILKQF